MPNMQWLSSLRLLTHLDMNGVNLSETSNWFQVINTLPSLVELHLSNCRLRHIDPHVPIHNLTSLTLLDLSFNNFTSSVPWWIFSITNLVSLDLSGCNFHGPVPSNTNIFRNLTALEFFHVYSNIFMNSSSVLKGLSRSVAGNLIFLDISSCDISSPVLDSLHNLTSLNSLDLSGNQLTKTMPKSLGNLCNLKYLDLSLIISFQYSFLTYILQSFFECKSLALESLFLRAMGLSGHLPDQLVKLIHLKYLQLDHNHIVGTIWFHRTIDFFKMDKESIFKDAIDYIKVLHDEERTIQAELIELESRKLEIQNLNPSPMKKRVDPNGSRIEILELNVSYVGDKTVLVNLKCSKRRDTIVRLCEVFEYLKLNILTANISTFSQSLFCWISEHKQERIEGSKIHFYY